MTGHYNALKIRALEIFSRCGWLNPVAWSVVAGFHPARAAYSYLLHLHRLGLLLRRHNASRGYSNYGKKGGVPACEEAPGRRLRFLKTQPPMR